MTSNCSGATPKELIIDYLSGVALAKSDLLLII